MASSQRHPEKDAAGIIRQIVNVVQACHFMGVMHRDIKHENFLFSSNDENALLKAIDFRCAVFIDKGEVYNDRVGTGCYVSPEVLQGHYGKEADICSAGVVLYILLCGQPPFVTKPEEHILNEIQNAPIDFESHPWPCISSAATALVKKMLIRNPKKRITAAKDILGSQTEKPPVSLLIALFQPV
ncbi:calcium-dependent protein kinase 27-like [Brassica rapa]|uniref:calcium-dependent protein kinase 27-like n=1 Tax=Brassica campestris TaxID=3711 RepID=UPI00142DC766|nr:calcium-dependent protein kinase 27-like [Brassica rapa]